MNDWQLLPLNQVCNIAIGGTPSRNIEEYWGGGEGFPWVAISDLHGRVITETSEKITLKGVNNSNVKAVREGTVIMSFKLSIGRVAYAGMELYTNEAIASFDLDDKLIDNNFFYYQLPEVAKSAITDSAIKGATLNKEKLNALCISFPDLNSQQKIAKILSTVDNLIEKTQSLIDKYTAIKQGMMADLFTRGIDMTTGDHQNPKGGKLRPSVEDAPELYKQTELGWVPKEWVVVDLESIANVDRGKFTHRPRDDAKCYGGEHPFIQTGSVTKAKGGFITEYKQTLSEFGRSVSREFSAGTIAVTIAANIADTGILNIPMCFPDSIVGVNVDEDKALIRFVEITIRRNKQRLDAIAPLSAQKNINLEDLRPLKLALPALSEQVAICKRYEVNESLISKEIAYLEKLNKQKKGLMQDLLTGKVKVA
ncbi:MAG: type I restriction enzyme S subunit [Oleispira sp.]|jgi:type I restriction enzyme S subunit